MTELISIFLEEEELQVRFSSGEGGRNLIEIEINFITQLFSEAAYWAQKQAASWNEKMTKKTLWQTYLIQKQKCFF